MVTQDVKLAMKITPEGVLSGAIAGDISLSGAIHQPVGYTDYSGPYEVTPRVKGQTLHTRDKHMTEDVTIHEIPVYSVSNSAGGDTVYIAKEV